MHLNSYVPINFHKNTLYFPFIDFPPSITFRSRNGGKTRIYGPVDGGGFWKSGGEKTILLKTKIHLFKEKPSFASCIIISDLYTLRMLAARSRWGYRSSNVFFTGLFAPTPYPPTPFSSSPPPSPTHTLHFYLGETSSKVSRHD